MRLGRRLPVRPFTLGKGRYDDHQGCVKAGITSGAGTALVATKRPVMMRKPAVMGPLATPNIVLEQLVAEKEKKPEACEPSESECIEHVCHPCRPDFPAHHRRSDAPAASDAGAKSFFKGYPEVSKGAVKGRWRDIKVS